MTEELELVAKYTDDVVKVYEKGKRPVVTRKDGFVKLYPDTPNHSFVVFLLFAKTYQYGLMICEIDDASIGLLY